MTTPTRPSGRGDGMHHRHIYLDGTWTASTSHTVIDVIEPATEKVIGSVPGGTPQDVDAAVRAARRAFAGWADTPRSAGPRICARWPTLWSAAARTSPS